MYAFLLQSTGSMGKAAVHLACWLMVIIRHDHCRVSTDMGVSPVTGVEDRRWFTASFELYFVFCAATETSEYQ